MVPFLGGLHVIPDILPFAKGIQRIQRMRIEIRMMSILVVDE